MKKLNRIVALVVIISGILMTGCLVSSIHPFFKTEDVIYNADLLGNWMDGDSSIWTIQRNTYTESFMGEEKDDNSYKMVYYEDGNGKSVLRGTLFQLKGVQYIDFYPDPDYEGHWESDMTSFHMLPTHTLARVQFNSDSILIYWYGEDWLNDLLEQNRVKIAHETVQITSYTSRSVLTASTDELQKFIVKYANDPRIVDEIEEIFARGYTNDQDDYGAFLKLKPYSGEIPVDENQEE